MAQNPPAGSAPATHQQRPMRLNGSDTVSMEVPVPLNDDDVRQAAHDLVDATGRLQAAKDERRAAATRYNDKIKHIEGEISRLRDRFNHGTEPRLLTVQRFFDVEQQLVTFRPPPDSGVEAWTEPMPEEWLDEAGEGGDEEGVPQAGSEV